MLKKFEQKQGVNHPAPSDTNQYQKGVIIMLTAKLSTYSPEEVEFLLSVFDKAVVEIANHSNIDCCGKHDCNSCKMKHVCYGISKMYDYLVLESEFGYPHCKK